MLAPKKVKHRKVHRGSMAGIASGNTEIHFGEFALKAIGRCWLTSNQIEALDPALLRPGRIDYRLYLGPATEEQKVELYRRFFPGASMVETQLFVDGHPEAQTMAEFQGLLLALEARGQRVDQAAFDFESDVREAIAQ